MSSNAPTSRHPGTGSSPDPLTGLFFKVTVDGVQVGDFAEVQGLSIEYEVLEHQEGGQNDYVHKLRGRAKYPNVTLKRGITNNAALLTWFKNCRDKADRKTVTIKMLPPDSNQPVRAWAFEGAFPVKWTGPNLSAGQSSVATETLEFAHRGLTWSEVK